MSRRCRNILLFCCNCRQMSTRIRIVPELNQNVYENIVSNNLNPKKHPGVCRMLPQRIPTVLFDAVQNALKDRCAKTLANEGDAFNRFLRLREAPLDDETCAENLKNIKERVERRMKTSESKISSEQELNKHKALVKSRSLAIFKKSTYNWKPVVYDQYTSLLYMMARLPQNYAVLCRVFNEIAVRDSQFTAKSIFDFGSGVGTAVWAAKHFWGEHMKEFYCVDTSSHMLDLAQFLVQGDATSVPLPGYYYRQFLPSKPRKYDIVVSAFSLIELASKQIRLETILNLWNQTGQYLVIVEHGTKSGLRYVKNDLIFQCPHDLHCPRLAPDQSPCNLEVVYFSLPLGVRGETIKKEKFSYVILKKGAKPDEDHKWPRIVSRNLKVSRQSICRVCTSEGKLQEVIFTKAKSGRESYKCARASRWGDLLPVQLSELEVEVRDWGAKHGEEEEEEEEEENDQNEEDDVDDSSPK
ncbi:methyltransferase-like protein 17, mitochondrial [Nilaparvata lugens]|uniref:methyltransferase-like protein 17, mitochondrial n=1 Tax=Nilaparvata lugens TaxID=108931 RepID=UPI00193E8974|nr:methyltransferase-like protein 17, mitochondrial [Nilaparvata lugens]